MGDLPRISTYALCVMRRAGSWPVRSLRTTPAGPPGREDLGSPRQTWPKDPGSRPILVIVERWTWPHDREHMWDARSPHLSGVERSLVRVLGLSTCHDKEGDTRGNIALCCPPAHQAVRNLTLVRCPIAL